MIMQRCEAILQSHRNSSTVRTASPCRFIASVLDILRKGTERTYNLRVVFRTWEETEAKQWSSGKRRIRVSMLEM